MRLPRGKSTSNLNFIRVGLNLHPSVLLATDDPTWHFKNLKEHFPNHKIEIVSEGVRIYANSQSKHPA
jgi:hypothetical protein